MNESLWLLPVSFFSVEFVLSMSVSYLSDAVKVGSFKCVLRLFSACLNLQQIFLDLKCNISGRKD